MNSQHAATTQRPKYGISMLNISEPHGLPTFHIVNTGIHPFRHRPKSPMSLIVFLPRGSVVRNCENPPPLFPESFFTRPALVTANVLCAHTSKAGRLGWAARLTRSELAAFGVDYRQSHWRQQPSFTCDCSHTTTLHYQLAVARQKPHNPHKQGPKLLPESPVISTTDERQKRMS